MTGNADHLQQFRARDVRGLPSLTDQGWTLKRYAILAHDRHYDDAIASAAGTEALRRLPKAGTLDDTTGNHGVGFQLVHFAETAVVSPVFYWCWGSVLANISQIRADWNAPTDFQGGAKDIIGCIWEMDIVNFEVQAWKTTLLQHDRHPADRLATYLAQHSGIAP